MDADRSGRMGERFKAGDVVVLKSGGPPMAVVKILAKAKVAASDDGPVLCVWRAGDDFKSRRFAPETLLPAPDIPVAQVSDEGPKKIIVDERRPPTPAANAAAPIDPQAMRRTIR
jgi:uncharacterized protein YodC (DUF2158 family)